MMSNRRVSFLRTYYTCIKMYNNGKCISAKYLNVCEHAIISFMLYCVIVFVVDSGLFFLLCDWPWTDISQFWHGQFTNLTCPWIFTKTAVLNREKRTFRAQNCQKRPFRNRNISFITSFLIPNSRKIVDSRYRCLLVLIDFKVLCNRWNRRK